MGIARKTIKGLLSGMVKWHGPEGSVYLTFDDGPHPVFTHQILGALESAGAKATFFMIGEEMERFPEIVEAVKAQGHAIGLHSYRHRHLCNMSPAEVVADLERSAEAGRRFGIRLRLYRPPYGELSLRRLWWCWRNGVKIIMWSRESRDSFVETAQELTGHMAPESVNDGDILLFHDDTAVTVEALPAVLGRFRSTGVRLSALGED